MVNEEHNFIKVLKRKWGGFVPGYLRGEKELNAKNAMGRSSFCGCRVSSAGGCDKRAVGRGRSERGFATPGTGGEQPKQGGRMAVKLAP